MRNLASLPYALLLLFAFAPPASGQNSHTEDFTTTAFQDVVNTTADWNIADGELKLFPGFVPSLVGSYDTPNSASGIVMAGDHAFIADGASGLLILDISDPAVPSLVGSYVTQDATGVTVAGDLAFIADGIGVHIVDISNPAAPSLVTYFGTNGFAANIAVAGDLAVIARGSFGLLIVDISNPAVPSFVSSYDTPGLARSVVLDGDRAYVADWDGGLHILDISNPAAPSFIGSFGIAGGEAFDVVVAGDLAFVSVAASGPGLWIVDISNPAAPFLVANYATPEDAQGIDVAGDRAFLTAGLSGLHILDISDPTTPTLVGTHDTPGDALGVAVAGDLAFVADKSSGLQILKISYPVAPSLVGSYDTPGFSYDTEVVGNLAFVAGWDSGLQIVDISDPASPTFVSSFDTNGLVHGVAVAGDFAFVADGNNGIRVIDVSNPAAPSFHGGIGLPSFVRDLVVDGDRLFVANDDNGMLIIDISNPASLGFFGAYNTTGNAYDVTVAGDLAFVADAGSGLQILDISDPTVPLLVTSYITPGSAHGVEVAGDFAFIADSATGLQILDISNPALPSFLGSYTTLGSDDVAVVGDLAFLADFAGGLQILDISNPSAPTFIGNHATQGNVVGVVVDGAHAFVTDDSFGLQIVQFSSDEYDVSANIGQSLAVENENQLIVYARLETTQASGVSWEISANAGGNWTPIFPAASWTSLTVPGIDLLWRSTHTFATPANPAVSDLTLEWLNEHAHIQSVTDIANDQGRQVSLEWQRSGHDFLGAPQQIVEYAVYRQIDPALTKSKMAALPALPTGASDALQAHASSAKAAGWHFITTVPVRVQDEYAVVVPTLTDSTIVSGQSLSTFMVSALTATPGVFFDSPVASGYSVDNLAPGVPAALQASYASNEVVLDWDDAEDTDFQYFRIYRDTNSGFEPAPGNLVQETAASTWTDPAGDPWGYFYKITTLDHAGNESEAAEPQSVSGAAGDVVPMQTTLLAAYPNPFNPSTKLSFELAAPAYARLKIFDASGRLVATLVDEQRASGRHEVVWNGKNSAGIAVASGVYLYRFEAGDLVQTKRMMLVK